VLLSLGFELTSTNDEGLDALHYSTRSGDLETISILLETAMEKEVSIATSKLPHYLFSSAYKVRTEIVQLLLDKGVDGSELDLSGSSPLATYFQNH
jgi:ankyrin repeat protein